MTPLMCSRKGVARGVSMIELLAVLTFVGFGVVGALVYFTLGRDARAAQEIVQAMDSLRTRAISATEQLEISAVGSAVGGTYAHMHAQWLVGHAETRYVDATTSSIRLPVRSVVLAASGVAPPWPTSPLETAQNAAVFTLTGVPRSLCQDVAFGMSHNFIRVEVNANVASDKRAGIAPSITQIGIWCDTSPTATVRGFFA